MHAMRVALAQLNPTIGDFDGNVAKLVETLQSLRADPADLVIFPEAFLTGYPPRDLLERDWFIERAGRALDQVGKVSREHPDTALLVGTVLRSERSPGKGLHNAAVLLQNGRAVATVHKVLLPTYDVFDEARYFDPGQEVSVVPFGDERLGVSICEDAWNDPSLWHRPAYQREPISELAQAGATIMINLSASPFYVGKGAVRFRLFERHARRHGVPLVLVNQVGGNDELVFAGRSMCIGADGGLLAYLPAFEEAVVVVDPRAARLGDDFVADEPIATIHDALVMGLRDYATKCGFDNVAVGLSGGIDSAVVCAIAARAVGPEHVFGVSMPSPYSSPGSIEDSKALAERLGIRFAVIPISDVYQAYLDELDPYLKDEGVGVTEENVQARIRGNVLMAISNEQGHLVLSTGNKSELAVGYCTLYGDMSGGLAVLSDVPKTTVYELAEYINRAGDVIPRAIIDKPPSAELKPDQRDRDTLPPYDTLDRILDLYVDRGRSVDEIVDEGFDREVVTWVVRAVNRNEYKRRQAPPGLKVTSKAFGMGRRMPIAARYGP
jgi:NAD+ synthase (glutamine-hydrolysing)